MGSMRLRRNYEDLRDMDDRLPHVRRVGNSGSFSSSGTTDPDATFRNALTGTLSFAGTLTTQFTAGAAGLVVNIIKKLQGWLSGGA